MASSPESPSRWYREPIQDYQAVLREDIGQSWPDSYPMLVFLELQVPLRFSARDKIRLASANCQ